MFEFRAKFYGLIFLIFLFISSDVFVTTTLAAFGGAVEGKLLTSYGYILQGVMLVLAAIAADFLEQHDLI